jgi:hypothetical protein
MPATKTPESASIIRSRSPVVALTCGSTPTLRHTTHYCEA